jgi:hypothetical protein
LFTFSVNLKKDNSIPNRRKYINVINEETQNVVPGTNTVNKEIA